MSWEALAATSSTTLLAASAFLVLALTGLAVALARVEFGKAARRRRRLHQALQRAERARAAARAEEARDGRLTPAEAARLAAFRARARTMVGEPLETITGLARVRALMRDGHSGWVWATLIGAFSMATHFGAYWLIAGGGWLGAALITMLGTAIMVALCLWVLLGLVGT